MAINPITGLEEDSPVVLDSEGKKSTGLTPLNGGIKAETVTVEEETPIATNIEAPTVITATTEEAVVDRGTLEGEPVKLELTRDTFTEIQAKQNAGQTLTDEEKLLAGRVKAQRDQGKTIESIFGEEERVDETLLSETQAQDLGKRLASGKDSALEALGLASIQFSNDERVTKVLKDQGFTDNQINQILRQRDAQLAIESRKGITEERISERESLLREDQTRADEKIRESASRLQDQTQRLRSLRGVGRSTATEEDILDLERQGNELIAANERRASLELQKIRLEESGAEAEAIDSINKAIRSADLQLQEKLNLNLENQKVIDQQLGSDFDTSINNMLNILEASGEDIGDFDDKATKALGYISDSRGNPLKLDADGNPIAPKNELGQDVKISNFKDANDNTYVYKNGVLSSIIQNDGTILSGDAVNTAKVPAVVKADKKAKERIDLEQKLRKEFNSSDQIDTFGKIKSSFERVKAGKNADSAAGDLALIFSFMKMLDPGSVVREGEFATAQNAAGIPDQIRNLYNKAQTGERLNTNQREDFLGRSKDIFENEKANAQAIRDQFVRIADDAGARSDFITGAFDDLADTTEIFELDEEETNELDTLFPGEGTTGTTPTDNTFKSKSGKEFKINFNQGDQTSTPKGTESAEFNNRSVTLDSNALGAFDKVNAEFKKQFNRDIKLGSEITASTRNVEQQQKLFGQGRTVDQLVKAGFSNEDATTFSSPNKNIVTNADGIKNKSRHQSGLALDIRGEDIANAKPILESLGFKQTIPKGDAGHFEFIG